MRVPVTCASTLTAISLDRSGVPPHPCIAREHTRDRPMNRIALLAAGCAVLALAACDHPDAARQRKAQALKVVSKLDCPETQGRLKRLSAAPDGLSCNYGADGVEVTLTLVQLVNGGAAAALSPIEAELRALMPKAEPAAVADAGASAGKDDEDRPVPFERMIFIGD
eukprot:gene34789-46727_t